MLRNKTMQVEDLEKIAAFLKVPITIFFTNDDEQPKTMPEDTGADADMWRPLEERINKMKTAEEKIPLYKEIIRILKDNNNAKARTIVLLNGMIEMDETDEKEGRRRANQRCHLRSSDSANRRQY